MFGIGPDATGKFHPKAIEALEYAGAWLRVNGEAIYNTRPRDGEYWKEGEAIRYTRTKDNRFIYAVVLKWPGATLALSSVRARAGSGVFMLGVNEPLAWRNDDNLGLVIDIPSRLQDPAKRPCQQAYAFRIEGQTRETAVRN
jgi:alpha-L-fucosidase